MLSENSMVRRAFAAAVKRLFVDVCSVYVAEKNVGAGGKVDFARRVLFENLPCRISFDSIGFAKSSGAMQRSRFTRKNLIPAAEISSAVRLFVEPQYDFPEGSEVRVLHEGEELVFRASGYAAVYSSHREIVLSSAERFV